MSVWVFLIVIVAIVGGLIIEYQKNKMKMLNRSQQNEEEVEELQELIDNLRSRVENLEAIAAGDPEEFKLGPGSDLGEVEIEQSTLKQENKQQVSDLAKKQRRGNE